MQMLVPDAQIRTGTFHETGLCLTAPNHHIRLCETVLEKWMDPLVHLPVVHPVEVSLLSHTLVGPMLLVLLLFAPDVRIGL